MSSVDERIVKMKFDNAEFKKNAADTKASLDSVNKSVDSAGKGKGLMDLNSNMQRVQVSASKMGIVAGAALATITAKAVTAGLGLAKSLLFEPVLSGFHLYESELTKLNTIMNATGDSQKKVQNALNDLNNYANKTIYSFDDMTTAVTKFTNAGFGLKQATTLAKNFSNMVAFAGGSAQDASAGMYALTQMMQLGYVQLQDFKQFDNAGLATVKFKQTLIDAAVAQGTLTKKGSEYVTKSGIALSATKNFNNSLQAQWATSGILNKALGQYNQNAGAMGKKAFAAAQQVRTFTAFMSTLKESIATGWSRIFRDLIGNLQQATSFWTTLSNAMGNAVYNVLHFADTTLVLWRNLGGAHKVLQGFENILAPIGALFTAVGKAWRAAFPNSGQGAGKGLYALSAGFEALTEPLKLLATLISHLVTPLTIFFQLVKIGGAAVKGIVGYISDFVEGLVGVAQIKAPSSGGILSWLSTLGSTIESTLGQVTALLDKGKSLKDAFTGIHVSLPSMPKLPSLSGLGGAGGAAKDAKSQLSGLASPLSGMSGQLESVSKGFKTVSADAKTGASNVQSAASVMGTALGNVWKWLQGLFKGFNVQDLVASFNLALLATFILSISRFLNNMGNAFAGFAGSGKVFTETLEQAGKAFKGFQIQAKAKLILNIGIAIGILAASLWLLSKIPADRLATALTAMAGIFLMLNHTMKSFGELAKSFDGKKISLNMFALSVGIVALGLAMILLATACLIMNKVKWTSIAKGLTVMYVAMKLMEDLGSQSKEAAKNMVSGAIAIGLVAASMLLLATALIAFKLVDWGSMGKAGVALLGVSLAVGALSLIPYEGIAKVGLALLLASVGMEAMAVALTMFALVKWESIGKAAVALALLTASLAILMAVGGPASAATMVGLAAAMVLLAGACLIFNMVDWSSIGKAALVLTLLLAALAIGAVILTAFLYAIAPISPVLITVAAAFALLGLGMLAFAAAMAIAITLGAAGVAAFAALATGAAIAIAVFLQTLAAEAPVMKRSFLIIMQQLIDTIVAAVPMIIEGIKRLWAAVKKEFTSQDKGKATGDAGKSWIQKLGDGIMSKIPMIVDKGVQIINAILSGLTKHAGQLGAEGAALLAKFINGIASKLSAVIQSGVNLINAFIAGVIKAYGQIAVAAANAVIKFIHSMAAAIRQKGPQLGDAMGDLGVAMVQGLIGGIGAMAHRALDAVGGLASGMVNKAKGIFKSHSPSKVFYDLGKFLAIGLTLGIQDYAASAITATASLMQGQIAVANEYMSKYLQSLDQQALAARGKANGLAAAAATAAAAAKKTKTKTDDNAAKSLKNQATAEAKVATAAEKKAAAAKAAQDAADAYAKKSTIEKAQYKSQAAQNSLAAAKTAEENAQKDLTQAAALNKQAKVAGVTPAQRKAMNDQAAALRTKARQEALNANAQLNNAKTYAAQSLALQKQAGDEAAAAYQASYDADAKAASDEAAFDALSDADKAVQRREQAAALQAQADKDLADAKKLAYTDLDAANALAQQAQDEANQARQYLTDAAGYDNGSGAASGGGTSGTVVNLDASDAAVAMMNRNQNLYDAGLAAAAAGSTVEFNQYNTSPEALNPTDVYRKTNNLLTYAAEKIDDAA